MPTNLKYDPDYAVAPGATLKELLDERGISQTALAVRTGMTDKTLSQIINGIAPITYETAEKLEMAIGVPARFWNERELVYREKLAHIAATERLKHDLAWLDEIPIDVLQQRGYVEVVSDAAARVRLALKFFGVSSVDAWREAWGNPVAQFRGGSAKEKRPGYVAAWLRMGDIQSEAMDLTPFDADEFRRALSDIRGMTTLPAKQWTKDVPARCALAGVAVVFTKEIPSSAVSGATRWKTKDKALIQLSLKFKWADQVWFTFFHEAGHILLHSKKQMFVEFGVSNGNNEEQEANEFARDILIRPEHAGRLPYLKNRKMISDFSQAIGIDQGIVVGRLQRDELAFHSAFNDLRRKLAWE